MDEDETTLLWLLGGVAVAWWFLGPDDEGGVLGYARQLIDSGVDLVLRGNRLTHAPYDPSTGLVPGSPQSLADSTALDLESYSLARAISSEEGRSDDGTKLAVGWAIKNRADAGAGSITSLVTTAKYAYSGYYGTQRQIDPNQPGYNSSNRYCSTANDPYDGDGQIALAIQNGNLPDPTGGAQYFDVPAFDDNPDQVTANRAAQGLVEVDVPGARSGLRFWAPA